SIRALLPDALLTKASIYHWPSTTRTSNMKRGLGSEVPPGLASSPVLGSVSAMCIQRCWKSPPSGRKIASMVKVFAPTNGRPGKKRPVSLPLNCTALPTGESTSCGEPSTLGVMPPMRERLSNFQTLPSCAQESLAEVARMPKTAATTMLHLLICLPSHLFLGLTLTRLSPRCNLPGKEKRVGEWIYEIAERDFGIGSVAVGRRHAGAGSAGRRERSPPHCLGGAQGHALYRCQQAGHAHRRHPEGAPGQAELGPAGDADPRL